MRIIRAEHLGMCFGVKDAIALALETARHEPLTVLGDLVHNDTVLAALKAKGVITGQHAERVNTQTVMVTAHGASERALMRTRALGLNVIEATCPLVRVAHHAVRKLAREGFHPVVIGKREHVEVRGLTEDLDEFDVVLSENDIMELKERPRFGVAAQTTQPIEKVRLLVNFLRQRFPNSEVRFIDTVCQPTKQRQHAAVELAQQCDVVVVIGGAQSNNTRELVETCSRYCAKVHHVQMAEDLRADWIEGATTVGITAGTSTPDDVLRRVEQRIQEAAARFEMRIEIK
ncbi:MAG TPA: 4-hydroxy-3-methylbut-2-enyl diphosphate reductase [Verrucomicrobiae bacterium]|jgi:4-hydroxy-3-methylbut-2-enyl diphosphate reductase|nr:4-hydroxy-3-methylbut-2-enyl diphosphate reductase [Verrucomicrobiae bacterium]